MNLLVTPKMMSDLEKTRDDFQILAWDTSASAHERYSFKGIADGIEIAMKHIKENQGEAKS